MFERIVTFDKILVTGPRGSGTQICAKMIAHDTKHKYVDESSIGVEGLYRPWSLLSNIRRVVVQCPALCRHIHMFSADETAIILRAR